MQDLNSTVGYNMRTDMIDFYTHIVHISSYQYILV